MHETVSVIIPNYNNGQWLSKAIQSCLDQGVYLKEIIVIDDQSDDDSLAVLNTWKQKTDKLKVFTSPEKGANNARNFGLEQATGLFIQWLDADDQLLPDKFADQLSVFAAHPDIEIVYSDIVQNFYENDQFKRSETRRAGPDQDYLETLLLDHWIANNSYLLKRSAADLGAKLNGWNPETPVHQDTEYFIKLAIAGVTFRYLPGVYSTYSKWSAETVSQLNFQNKVQAKFFLFENFKATIEQSEKVNLHNKKVYLSIINTTLLQLSFYNRALVIKKPFSLFSIRPRIIKTRFKYFVYFQYAVQTLRYWINRVFAL
ncbi:MAG: glycosyltransferase [Saprospiraceae bacterium]|nr:glycosyltransferase [Saprospiraceae bacterium]